MSLAPELTVTTRTVTVTQADRVIITGSNAEGRFTPSLR